MCMLADSFLVLLSAYTGVRGRAVLGDGLLL